LVPAVTHGGKSRPKKRSVTVPNSVSGDPGSPFVLSSAATWRLLAAPIGALVLLIVLGRIAGGHWVGIEQSVDGAGVMGQVLFVCASAVLTACCLPVAGMAFSAGALYGFWPGLPLMALANLLSALVMFAMGRGMLRGRILALMRDRPRLAAIDRMVGDNAVKLNLLARLAPVNFGLFSYTLAAGRSKLWAYVLGTAGALPGTAIYVWMGLAARNAGSARNASATGNILMVVIGVVAIGLLTWLVSRLVRQAWQAPEIETTTD